MEIIEATLKEYQGCFPTPYHIFNSVEFNEINKEKCESIHYLMFRDSKIRLGLIVGQRNNELFSPFSASFGCFSFVKERVGTKKIDEAVKVLDNYLKENKISLVKFILPPLCYNTTFISKLINCLYRNDYKNSCVNLNFIFEAKLFNDRYKKEVLHKDARRNLKIALKQDLEFQKTNDIELVYNVIAKNREARGFPLRMSLEQIKETVKYVVTADCFVVKLGQDYIASALIYHIAKGIAKVIYWGDIPEFSAMKTMNFLSYKVFEYYKNAGIEIVDIGPSTENGIPNYGLCDFKESIGCSVEPKFIFEKKIINIEFTDYSKDFLEKSWEWLNDSEIKSLTMTPDLTREKQEEFFNSLPERTNYFIKGLKLDGEMIGACGLKNITETDGEYWGYIGEKENFGKGIGKEMMKYVIDYAKEKGLESVYLNVSETNKRAYNLYAKTGFKEESENNNTIKMRLVL